MISPRLAAAAAWLALVATGCGERTRPEAPLAAPARAPEPFLLRAVADSDLGVQDLAEELQIQVFRYDVKAPVNHRTTFWIEVWRDGKLDRGPSWGSSYQPRRERPFFGRFTFSIMDGQAVDSPKTRWSTRLDSYPEERRAGTRPTGRGTSSQTRWIDDPLKAEGITNRSGQSYPIASPIERGRTYTLHALAGSRGQAISLADGADTAELARTVAVAVFLRARIERVPTDRLRDWDKSGAVSIPPAPLKD